MNEIQNLPKKRIPSIYRGKSYSSTHDKPKELKALPEVLKRVNKVKQFRLKSKAVSTQKFATTPTLFCQIAQPDTDYLLVPRVSSERRKYIPIGFICKNIIGNDQVLLIPNATLYLFGILTL